MNDQASGLLSDNDFSIEGITMIEEWDGLHHAQLARWRIFCEGSWLTLNLLTRVLDEQSK